MHFLQFIDAPLRVTVLLGNGLIGSAIVECMKRNGCKSVEKYPTDWSGMQLANEHYKQSLSWLVNQCERVKTNHGPEIKIDFIWSAGRVGFSAKESEIEPELTSFTAILDLVKNVNRLIGPERMRFFHISSAGGLYEGQKCISQDSKPRPMRPYGHLKLEQEKLLTGLDIPIETAIYRPSSVYGPVKRGQRLGLIPSMIRNGLQHRVTYIYARDSTLRDFIWSCDLAHHISSQILSESVACGIHVLHSGTPVSVGQVRHLVESSLQKRIYIQYDGSYDNSLDITFAGDGLFCFGNTTSMLVAMKRTIADMMQL